MLQSLHTNWSPSLCKILGALCAFFDNKQNSWETGEIAEVLSNKGLMEKNTLIEHPSKAGNQCFSYPLTLKREWTCSLVSNILGKLLSVDTVEFHFSDLLLFLPFMKQYAFIYCTIHQCLISNKLYCYILNKNLTFQLNW